MVNGISGYRSAQYHAFALEEQSYILFRLYVNQIFYYNTDWKDAISGLSVGVVETCV